MTDCIKIKAIEMADDRVDSRTDRRVLSGHVAVAVEYGETSLDIAVRFHGKASPDEAVADALRHIENLGHFMEGAAARTRLEYQRGG